MKKFLALLLIPFTATAAVFPVAVWQQAPLSPILATGGTITQDGDYKVHTFNSSGTFQVLSGSGRVDYLIIGGGGGGGNDIGGGGGAGRVRHGTGYLVKVGSYTVTVGAGGAGGAASADGALDNGAKSGGSSSFDSITAEGGGYGCWFNSNGSAWAAAVGVGGSGGGGCITTTAGPAGSAFSNAGGTGTGNIGAGSAGAGGGGCGGAGSNASSGVPGNGGPGCTYNITGASVCYAGGGAGGNHTGSSTSATATCGGGNGSRTGGVNGSPGTDGTGGGGGSSGGAGPSFYAGGKGGDGVVIVRYYSPASHLLIHFDEASGSTSMADSGFNNRTLTNVSSGVVTSSTNQKFSNNGNFGAGSQELTTPMDSNLAFGTGDFTIEGWFYYGTWGDGAMGLITVGENSGNEDWSLEFSPTGSNGIRFTSAKHSINLASSVQPSNNTWTHVAVTRASGTLRIFVQGTQAYSGSNATNFNVSSSASLHIGRRPANANYFIGRMDEIRILKGRAVYTSNFTPPSLPF